MVKVVDKGEKICTLSLDGTECSIVFQDDYKYFAVQNDSGSEVNISLSRDFNLGDDGVMSISNGNSVLFPHMKPNVNQFFAKGSGKIQVFASNEPINPFKSAPTFDGGVQASGNPVQLDGLQEGVQFSEMVVSGKNLLTYPYNETTKTVNGITFTDNGDGSLTVKGTATARSVFWLSKTEDKFILPKNTPIYCSVSKEKIPNMYLGYEYINGTTWISTKSFPTTGGVDIFDFENFDRLVFNIVVDPGNEVDVTLYPQLELGSTPTAYEPPITGRELKVGVCGKNLLKYPYVDTTKTSYGITFTDNGDGSITASGTHNGNTTIAYFAFMPWWANANYDRLFLPKGNTVSLKSNGLPSTYNTMLVAKSTNNGADAIKTIYAAGENTATYTATQDCYIACGIMGSSNSIGQTVDFTVHPQLELGSIVTPYEPYNGAEYTITPTSNPYVIPNDIRQVEGLNVITVSEGELSVVGVHKNAAIKRIWDEIDEIKTAIIVSNGESE